MSALVIHLWGKARELGQSQASTQLRDVLQQCATNTPMLVTDWNANTVSGIDTLQATAATAPAVLEKKLRDSGESDGVTQVLVHQSQTQIRQTDVVYTAVPLHAWREVLEVAQNCSRSLLVLDWHRLMIDWLVSRKQEHCSLIAVSAEGLDLIAMRQGRVLSLQRWVVHNADTGSWQRMGQRALSWLQDMLGTQAAHASHCMWALEGADSHAAQLMTDLAPLSLQVWSEQCTAWPPDTAGHQPQPLDKHVLSVALSTRRAVNPWMERVSRWADVALPSVSASALALSLIIGATAGLMHWRTSAIQSQLTLAQSDQETWKTLHKDVQQAETLAQEQAPLRSWARARLDSAKLPDIQQTLLYLRQAAEQTVAIDEVGLVVDKGAHLLTVVGHTRAMEDSMKNESNFVQALQSYGFSIQKRDLLLEQGQPRFKLSMTWSAS